MKKKLFIFVAAAVLSLVTLLAACSPKTFAVDKSERTNYPEFDAYIYTRPENERKMPFRFYAPEAEEGEKLPLIVFLHSVSEWGSDNNKQLIGEFVENMKKRADTHKCYVLAPQISIGFWDYDDSVY